MWWRAAGWGVSTSTRAATRIGRAALSGESAAELIDVARSELRKAVRTLVGSEEDDDPFTPGGPSSNGHSETSLAVLRERIAALLGLPVDRVSVKASTGNLDGSEGAGRSISARAVAVVERSR
jgi:hypothetical protein